MSTLGELRRQNSLMASSRVGPFEPTPDYARNCMTVPRYCSMTNLNEDVVGSKQPSPPQYSPPSKYQQRTCSFDDSYLLTARHPMHFNPCPSGAWNMYPGGMPPVQKLGEEYTVFRPPVYGTTGKASGEYCANSYFGWHQPMNAMRGNMGSSWSLSAIQPDMQPSHFCTLPRSNPPLLSTYSGKSSSRRFCTNKWSLLLFLLVLVIIIALIIAAGVAVWSQVKTHNSVIKLVRQYRGHMMVVDGPLLDFDGQLLSTDSEAFKRKARQFEARIDAIFGNSGLDAMYEGSEVTEFRFIVEIPAMEVYFNVKTKVDVALSVMELLTVLRDGVKTYLVDAVIDLPSLTLENQRLPNANL